jgi:SAM-dependent methyltransferase
MKRLAGVGLENVQEVYGGPEGQLWELIMGQQIHIGGFASSMDLAGKAAIAAGSRGVDLCCCNGAGMRFLLRFRDVGHMTGVDATRAVIELAKQRCAEEGFSERVDLRLDDVTDSGLPSNQFDFVWGEDAWCYVADKGKLIVEAARMVKPGGIVAFTDWLETPLLNDAEGERFMAFMKFPNMLSLDDYIGLLRGNGCSVVHGENTNRFAPCIDLYIEMLTRQLTSDALRIVGYNQEMMQMLAGEMAFAQSLAREGKLIQGLIVARKDGA